jgi:serine/threonine-protein kinase
MSAITPEPVDPLLGSVIGGKYRIEARLGGGAMGTVYRAVDARGVPCAVKVLQDEAVSDESLRERFRREAEALFELKHPNILEVRDYGVDLKLELPFLVMELLQGRTLEDMVVEHMPDPQTGFELGKQVICGLAHAHKSGVLHRDMKTENVFVTWDGRGWVAKLLDFGLVKFTDDAKWGPAKKLTMQGAVFGSPAYMSPEQGTGTATDARSDVYSAGVVLYELLTGSWPFEVEDQMQMLRAHLMDPPPPLASKREGLVVRPELEAVLMKALAKRPNDRFRDAHEMLAVLEAIPSPAAWIAGMTHVPAQPLPPPSETLSMPAPSRNRTLLITAAIMSAIVFLGLAAAAALIMAR